jgi:hypothetical protein
MCVRWNPWLHIVRLLITNGPLATGLAIIASCLCLMGLVRINGKASEVADN